jgi:hypothetical protein
MFYVYPRAPHERIHGPGGYTDYSSFKDWLRDEFEFRCIYCLTRETWRDDGAQGFGVDHVLAKSTHRHLECEYTNLVYCCNRCNSAKLKDELLDPCREAFSVHVLIGDEGQVQWLTVEGERMVRKLRLNDQHRVRFRQTLIRLARCAAQKPDGDTAQALRYFLGYPYELPDLSKLSPPRNSKLNGIEKSHFERRRRGELPDTY